jgi:ribose 5-phosphate isomerase B
MACMTIALGADHAGFELKERIKQYLHSRGVQVDDRGTQSTDSVDYPDYAKLVGEEVAAGTAQRGILVCGSGIGMAITANKIPGIRAANVASVEAAELSRRHNDANVLTLGARLTDEATALRIVDRWLETEFEGGRHQRRVQKIAELESQKLVVRRE